MRNSTTYTETPGIGMAAYRRHNEHQALLIDTPYDRVVNLSERPDKYRVSIVCFCHSMFRVRLKKTGQDPTSKTIMGKYEAYPPFVIGSQLDITKKTVSSCGCPTLGVYGYNRVFEELDLLEKGLVEECAYTKEEYLGVCQSERRTYGEFTAKDMPDISNPNNEPCAIFKYNNIYEKSYVAGPNATGTRLMIRFYDLSSSKVFGSSTYYKYTINLFLIDDLNKLREIIFAKITQIKDILTDNNSRTPVLGYVQAIERLDSILDITNRLIQHLTSEPKNINGNMYSSKHITTNNLIALLKIIRFLYTNTANGPSPMEVNIVDYGCNHFAYYVEKSLTSFTPIPEPSEKDKEYFRILTPKSEFHKFSPSSTRHDKLTLPDGSEITVIGEPFLFDIKDGVSRGGKIYRQINKKYKTKKLKNKRGTKSKK